MNDLTAAERRALEETVERLKGRRAVNGTAPSKILGSLQILIRAMSGESGSHLDGEADTRPMPLALTYARVAEELAISESSVKKLVSSGQLRSVLIGDGSRRVLADDLRSFLDHLTERAPDHDRLEVR